MFSIFSKNRISKVLTNSFGIPEYLTRYYESIPIPFAYLTLDGKILWLNNSMKNISNTLDINKKIGATFKELGTTFFTKLSVGTSDVYLSYENMKYRVDARVMMTGAEKVVALMLIDETIAYDLAIENDYSKNVIGFIYIDNFEEVAERMEDSKASMLLAMVDRRLTRYVSYNHGVIKKLEKDKYFFVTTKKDIKDIMDDKFSILEQTKEIISDDNIPLTLSIGIGLGGSTIESNHEKARIAMDMALGRGGDQAVVKDGKDTLYFGGKSASSSSNARVRSRVKSTSFKEILDTKDKVLIMGHRDGDFDSFGASIGMYNMAKNQGKDCHIVINSLAKSVVELKTKFIENEIYENTAFLNGSEALAFCDENTLLILVDHNIATLSDEPRLLDRNCDYVVFDHHRLAESSLQDSVLSYIDPSASSTSELVSEMMIYFEERIKLKNLEADAMLAGIIIDTMHFTYQTSSKTFEAASFLKKRGADNDRVRKLLRIDEDMIRLKNESIEKTEFYKSTYAISFFKAKKGFDVPALRAEIANELINIRGIKASIVISVSDNNYEISCRSIDEVNSQVLMEKLGGGGHRSSAGAFINADDENEVLERIKKSIDEIETEGEYEK